MNIAKIFAFLIEEHGLIYQHQSFTNCYGGNWQVETHSFYNESGCFTIYIEVQRGMSFWYASKFSTNYEDLCEKEVDIYLIEPEIWNKHSKIWFFNRPFFWWTDNKLLSVFAEALKVHLAKGEDFLGIKF